MNGSVLPLESHWDLRMCDGWFPSLRWRAGFHPQLSLYIAAFIFPSSWVVFKFLCSKILQCCHYHALLRDGIVLVMSAAWFNPGRMWRSHQKLKSHDLKILKVSFGKRFFDDGVLDPLLEGSLPWSYRLTRQHLEESWWFQNTSYC